MDELVPVNVQGYDKQGRPIPFNCESFVCEKLTPARYYVKKKWLCTKCHQYYHESEAMVQRAREIAETTIKQVEKYNDPNIT